MADSSDPFEMFRRIWGPLGIPTPGMAMPTLDPEEVEKRIADLKSVEGWLSLNLNMVKMTIQGLEIQKAALEATRGGGIPKQAGEAAASSSQAFADMASSGASAANSMMWPWTLMQQAIQGNPLGGPAAGATKPGDPDKGTK